MLKLDLPTFDLPNERGLKTHCQSCASSFGVTTREHICKRCFRSVCDNCSPYKVRSYRADLQHRLHRMCNICHVESQVLHRYVQSNKLKWGEDSDMSLLWLKQLGYKVTPKNRASQKIKKQFAIQIEELWKSLNFSFREFIGITIDQAKIENREVINMINICLSEVCTSKTVEPEQAIYLLMFFLAHSSPSNAVLFTKSVLQLLSLQEPSLENMTMFLSLMQCTDIEIYKMQNFLEQMLEVLIKTATVNYFTAEMNIQIIGFLISKRNFEEIEKGIAFVLSQRKEFICKNSNKTNQIIVHIVKNIRGASYRKVVRELDKNNSNFMSNSSYNKSETSTIFTDQKVEKLIRENEELKIKNKNQEDQIMRLQNQQKEYREKQKALAEKEAKKSEEDKWMKARKKSNLFTPEFIEEDEFSEIKIEVEDNSFESFYEQEDEELEISFLETDKQKEVKKKMKRMIRSNFNGFIYEKSYDNVLEELKQKYSHKRAKGIVPNSQLAKKYRPKEKKRTTNLAMNNRLSMKKTKDQRMSTHSEKNFKKQVKKQKKEEEVIYEKQKSNYQYEQQLMTKNEEISKLKKQLNLLKFNLQEQENEKKKLVEQIEEKKEENKEKQDQFEKAKKENVRLEENLRKMQEMNKKLMIKMKQLSNMLMDKEEEQVTDSTNSLEELAKAYEQELKKGQNCAIF